MKIKKINSQIFFAVLHWEVIEKYGRYPHRNSILGRESTDEELAYLSQPGTGF
jgi:uncharacterized protein (DUF924 family)